MAASLSRRQASILLALCRQYVREGRPVASAVLCKEQGLDWSSATIRAELGALERAGLVHKPHSASGRVPTPEGWRVFVDQLPRAAARPEHQRLLDVGLADGDPRRGLRATARVLSELAGCVAIGFVGEARPGMVRAIELVPLAGGSGRTGRVLVMLGLEDGGSSVRTVELDRAMLDDDGQLRQRQLQRLAGMLRDLTVGRSLEQARVELRELLAAQQARVDRCVAEALRIGVLLCAAASFDPLWMQVAGHGSLLGGEAEAGAPAGDLLAALEDYQHVAEILCQLLPEQDDPRASVRLDLGLREFAGQPGAGVLPAGAGEVRGDGRGALTLVGCRLRLPGTHPGRAGAGPIGALALLGSPRMDYEAVIPLIEYAARAMAARG